MDAPFENLSNKEIAAKLNMSERTAKFHVSNLLAKAASAAAPISSSRPHAARPAGLSGPTSSSKGGQPCDVLELVWPGKALLPAERLSRSWGGLCP
jgi:hypothetical protein